MNVLCVCPTHNRPALAANALACFLAQDYPADQRQLLILDDAGQLAGFEGHEAISYQVATTGIRFDSLPDKFNEMLAIKSVIDREPRLELRGYGAPWRWPVDAVAVWQDDAIVMPWHLSEAVHALQAVPHAVAAKSRRVWSIHASDQLVQEAATGGFHASLVIRAEHLLAIGGWPDSERADFDQLLIAQCMPAVDPTNYFNHSSLPGHVFRSVSPGARHVPGMKCSSDRETWGDRCAVPPHQITHHGPLVPRMDEETQRVYAKLAPPNEVCVLLTGDQREKSAISTA